MKQEKEKTPAQLMAEFHPVPQRGGSLEKKFTFFYKPYNYIVNTHKFMRFEEEPTPEILEEHRALSPYWRNLESTPWTNSRPESIVVHNRAVDEFSKDLEDCKSWRDVNKFMFSGDSRTFNFVMNQLMRSLGVKRKKKKEKRHHHHRNKHDPHLNFSSPKNQGASRASRFQNGIEMNKTKDSIQESNVTDLTEHTVTQSSPLSHEEDSSHPPQN